MAQLILNRLKNNDKEALKELFDQYYAGLTRFALRLIPDPMTAEEIAQDVFIYVWEKRASLHIRISLEAYLYRAVKNKCINHIRSKDFRLAKTVDGDEALDRLQVSHSEMESTELAELIEKGLSRLPLQTSSVYALSRNAGLSYAEIAKKLDVSQKTVEYHVSSALRFLREFLSRHGYLLLLASLLLH